MNGLLKEKAMERISQLLENEISVVDLHKLLDESYCHLAEAHALFPTDVMVEHSTLYYLRQIRDVFSPV